MARRAGRTAPPSPLEQRDGVDPVRLRLPGGARPAQDEGARRTVRAYLLERYAAAIGAGQVEEMLAAGRFVAEGGRPVDAATPYEAGAYVWFHRDLLPEPAVPFPVRVVHRDERIVVADKPHFLATTPRGRHVTQTALALLRRDLDLPRLSPAHRLDRLTAGVLLFTARREVRGAYQTQFARGEVDKTYLARAADAPKLGLPTVVRSRIIKRRGHLQAIEEPGEPNAQTLVEHLGDDVYRLTPKTGRTHQLRVHMASLGLPIVDDPLYPNVIDVAPDDFSRPLQLLAHTLAFDDPLSGDRREFVSKRTLS